MKFVILACLVTLLAVGCESEQEAIRNKQIDVCKKNIREGLEPTEFCLALLPEYRGAAPAQTYSAALPHVEQPQAERYVQPQAPIVMQNAPAAPQDNTLRDMALGGMAGYMAGKTSAPQQVAPTLSPALPETRYVTRYKVIQQPPKPAPVTKKPSAMDMSKLAPYGARPAPVPKSSYSFTRKR